MTKETTCSQRGREEEEGGEAESNASAYVHLAKKDTWVLGPGDEMMSKLLRVQDCKME